MIGDSWLSVDADLERLLNGTDPMSSELKEDVMTVGHEVAISHERKRYGRADAAGDGR